MTTPDLPPPSDQGAVTRRLNDPEPAFAPPPVPTPQGRRLPILWIMVGLIGVVVLAGGTAVTVLALRLFQGQREAPALVTADTQIFASLNPNLSSAPGIQNLQRAYAEVSDSEPQQDVDQQLEETFGVNFTDDIQPWLGLEIAIAVNAIDTARLTEDPEATGQDVDALLLLASRDDRRAQAFLDKQRAGRERAGEQFTSEQYNGVTITTGDDQSSPIRSFAIAQGFVLFATDPAVIKGVIDRNGGGANLAQDPGFRAVTAALPREALAYGYVSGTFFRDLSRTGTDEQIAGLEELGLGSLADQVAVQQEATEALQGFGVAITVPDSGVQLDTALMFDMAALPEQVRSQFDEGRRNPINTALYDSISGEAVMFVAGTIPASFKQTVLDLIDGLPDGPTQLDEFEQQTGLSLERDLLDWLVGDFAMVVLPGDPASLPVVGYMALRSPQLDAARGGLANIEQALGDLGGLVADDQSFGGADYRVLDLSEAGGPAVGYGFLGETVVVGVGADALSAAGQAGTAPITGSENFRNVQAQLFDQLGGLLYVDMPRTIALLDTLGVSATDEDTPEQQQFERAMEPIAGIVLAGEPGASAQGLMRARLFVEVR